MTKPNVLILGAADHGKDEAATILCELTGWQYRSSSLFACERAVLPTLAPLYNYASIEECYNDRGAHRVQWRNLIRVYNRDDKTRLARELLAEANVYVGMRSRDEYEACKAAKLFDYTLWVSAYGRVGGYDPSLDIVFDPACMHELNNNRSKAFLREQIEIWYGCSLA